MAEPAASRAGSFGAPTVEYQQSVTGAIASTLPSVTAALAGTHTASAAGTIAVTLPTLTAALSGTVANPGAATGTIASTLPTVTAALSGVIAPTGTITSTLPTVTAALAGQVLQPITGTLASTLPSVTAVLTGVGGVLTGAVDPYAPETYKRIARRRRKKVKDAAELRRLLRVAAGLEPAEAEEGEAPDEAALPLGPFLLTPDLTLGPLRERLALAQGELSELDRQHRQIEDEEAWRAILLADDAAPALGEIDLPQLEEDMAQARAAGEVIVMSPGASGQFQDVLQSQAQVAEVLQQTLQGLAQVAEQQGQAIQALMQSQQELLAAVKAPRRKTMTVTRGKRGEVTGADVLEEADA